MGPLTSLRAFGWSQLSLAGYSLFLVAFCREGAVPDETLSLYSWTAYALIAASMGVFLLDALNCQKTEIFHAISRTLTSLRQDFLTVGSFLCRVFAEIVCDTDSRLSSLFQSRHDSVGTFEYALLPWQEVNINSLRVAPRSEIE
ncbi:hypothetical protein Mal65_52720 [Crateriforma conspicua]|nr:hypothetical protein Mal65_52720 [Crateriforma conspicua]